MGDIGIYKKEFIDYLKKHLGEDAVNVKSKNIVCRCPWCEMDEEKQHYHLYISTEVPIFQCFYAGCPASGNIKKLLKKISGLNQPSIYVNQSAIKKTKIKLTSKIKRKKLILPEYIPGKFKQKELYLSKRFGFRDIRFSEIPGLILDVEEFININKIKLDEKQQKLIYFLQSNFIGFKSEHESLITFRNVDSSSSFRHYKLSLYESDLLDYYKISGNPKGKKIVLAEGIFDIYVEYLFDSLKMKEDILMYACGYTAAYQSLLKSIAFHEQIYKPEVVILSDKDVKPYFYKKIKNYKKHLYSTLDIFYNKSDKDFGSLDCIPQQIYI